MIDTTFNFHSDSNGGDPDCKSPTLYAGTIKFYGANSCLAATFLN